MDSEKRKQKFWGYGFRFSSAECFLKFGEILDSARRKDSKSKLKTLSRALYHFCFMVVTQSFLGCILGIRLGHFR
jgi:hypothetical protein